MSEWLLRAVCRGAADPDLWFPDGYRGTASRQQIADAKALCQVCPVRQPCLDSALQREGSAKPEARYGIYGGLTEGERYAIRRNHARGRAA